MKPDPKYIAERDMLIPIAEGHADGEYGTTAPKGIKAREQWYADWNLCFHSTMNQLWLEHIRG